MPEDDFPPPPLPEFEEPAADESPGGETTSAPPVARAFICARCKKGRLDPTGLKMGQAMACPECGHRTRVTLEHTMGEERASRRQKVKKTFEEMTEEERADFLFEKNALEKLMIFIRFKLGPRGVVGLYLSLVVVAAAIIIGGKLASGDYEMQSVEWWVVVLWIIGGALAGVAGHFGYVTLLYYYKKKQAAKGGGGRRSSVRRRSSSIRRKKPVEEE